jgi:hypothetical protein
LSTELPSWNDTATTGGIVEFVETAARDLPPEERVAVFDNDGTLWCEKPMPIELGFILQRFVAMAEQDESLREKPPGRRRTRRITPGSAALWTSTTPATTRT